MYRFFFLLFVVCGFNFASLGGLELQRVILATNNNETYIQFWPIVAPLWSKMGLRPTLALIADETCVVDTTIGDVIRFDPIPGVPESLQAQAIRLLLPALFPDDSCLISDIDMLPISRSYFLEGAARCPDDGFLIYRDRADGPSGSRYPMCYFAAKGSVFQSVFDVFSYSSIPQLIQQWAALGHGWDTDELMLYQYVNNWERTGGRVVRLGHGVGPRLDRKHWDQQTESVEIEKYIDCHCPRPYSINKPSIDRVVVEIEKLLGREV